jgi:hypothetical protein
MQSSRFFFVGGKLVFPELIAESHKNMELLR